MRGVLEGFGVIVAVITVGYGLARAGVLGPSAPEALSRLVFFVGAPALLFVTLSRSDLGAVFSSALVVTAVSVAIAALTFISVARILWHRPVGLTTIGALASSYVNAGNLGIPVAVYVLGDASYVAPVMLFQLVILAPISFAVLDTVVTGSSPSVLRLLTQPFRNPVTMATLAGVVVSGIHWDLPPILERPIDLVAGLAVPAALIAYGMSLRGAPRLGADGSAPDLVLVTVLKVAVQPLTAYLVGRFALGLNGEALFAVTLLAALPTAQNVFIYAQRYAQATALARDAIFVTTTASAATILIIAALLA